MSDFFSSLIAIQPFSPKTAGKQSERAPGISPSMKDGIYAERTLASVNPLIGRIPAAQLQTNLIEYMKLDGNFVCEKNYFTSSGNVVQQSSTSWTTGKINNGVSIATGGAFWLQFNRAITGGGTWSQSFWIYPTVDATQNLICTPSGASGGIYRLGGSGGQISFYYPSTHYFTTGVAPANAWTHVVVTHNGTVKIYLNGVLDLSTPATYTTFVLGTWGRDPWGNNFTGKMDEYGVWDRILTPDEVSALYEGGLGRQYPF